MRTVTVLLLMTAPICLAADQARETRASIGTAALQGTVVVDDAEARPLRRALVQISIANDPRTQRSTTTDDQGRFAFDRLPAGNATVIVTKAGYVRTHFGARRPGSTVGAPVALVNGETAGPIAVKVPRGGVITGIVMDETGQPVRFVPVRLQRATTWPSGERTLSTYRYSVPIVSTTDDRGMYRLFGLPAGDYVVSIQPRPIILGPLTGATMELRQTTEAELRWADLHLKLGRAILPGQPAPAPPAPGATVGYASVFHPGTTDLSAAVPVTVRAGQERTGVDFRMQFVPTARVAGRVVDPNGQPAANVQLTVSPKSNLTTIEQGLMAVELGLTAGGVARTGADGSFALEDLPPARYTLVARTVAPPGASESPGQQLWTSMDLQVDGRDLEGLSLALSPGMRVSGTLVFETAATGVPEGKSGQLRLYSAPPHVVNIVTSINNLGRTRSFEIEEMPPGRYRINASMPSWTLKSAMLRGRDVADEWIEIRPGEDIADLVVTFTDTPAELTGTLFDAAGRPASDLAIVLFTTSRSGWFQGSRRLKAPVRPNADGRFSFTGLAAGEYHLAALADYEPSDWYNPHFLEQAAAAAITIVLKDGEKKTQDLRVAR